MPRKISKPRFLLVEGHDEVKFYEGLIKYLELKAELFQIETYEGNAQAHEAVKMLPRLPGWEKIEALGIICDAEDDAKASFQRVSDALFHAELAVPQAPNEWCGATPRVGVFIQPGGDRVGKLETMCLEAVQENPLMNCVESFFQCVQELGISVKKKEKAQAHTFIAACEDPTVPVGVAGLKDYWNWESQVWDEVKRFLKKM